MSATGSAEATQARAGSTRGGEQPFAKLKPGPGRKQEDVRADQRARLRAAVIELTAERGYGGITVRGLSRTSGVSTRTFYAHFASVEECFASAHSSIVDEVARDLSDAIAAGPDREAALRSWVGALVGWVEREPRAAKFAFTASYEAGPALRLRVRRATTELERRLAVGLQPLNPSLVRALLAGIERVLRNHLENESADDLAAAAAELGDWCVDVCRIKLGRPPAFVFHREREDRPMVPVGRADPSLAAFDEIGGDRGRSLAAIAKLSIEDGYSGLTPPEVRRAAGVSRRSFDRLFEGLDACYLTATEAVVTAAVCAVLRRVDREAPWSLLAVQLAVSICGQVGGSPILARLGFIDPLAVGTIGLRRRERLLTTASEWLLAALPLGHQAATAAAEATAAASWRVIQADLQAAGGRPRRDPTTVVAQLLLALGDRKHGEQNIDHSTW